MAKENNGKKKKGKIQLKPESDGTLSARFIAKVGEYKYFWKTFRHSLSCGGGTSRDIVKNEIMILELLKKNLPETYSYYREPLEVEGLVGILCEDLLSNDRGQNLQERIRVKDGLEQGRTDPRKREDVVADSYDTLSVEEIIDLTKQLTSQLKELHNFTEETEAVNIERGIIHMDISPSNILVIYGREKNKALLMDFGIARGRGEDLKELFNESVPGAVSGAYYGSSHDTPLHNRLYSVPEEEIDAMEYAEPVLDTYNLANMLCLMMTGRLVEHWKSVSVGDPGRLEAMIKSNFDKHKKLEPGKDCSDYYDNIYQIIAKGTADKADDRFQTTEELETALSSINIDVPLKKIYKKINRFRIPPVIGNYDFIAPELDKDIEEMFNEADNTLDEVVGRYSGRLTDSYLDNEFVEKIEAAEAKAKGKAKKRMRRRPGSSFFSAAWISGGLAAAGILLGGAYYHFFGGEDGSFRSKPVAQVTDAGVSGKELMADEIVNHTIEGMAGIPVDDGNPDPIAPGGIAGGNENTTENATGNKKGLVDRLTELDVKLSPTVELKKDQWSKQTVMLDISAKNLTVEAADISRVILYEDGEERASYFPPDDMGDSLHATPVLGIYGDGENFHVTKPGSHKYVVVVENKDGKSVKSSALKVSFVNTPPKIKEISCPSYAPYDMVPNQNCNFVVEDDSNISWCNIRVGSKRISIGDFAEMSPLKLSVLKEEIGKPVKWRYDFPLKDVCEKIPCSKRIKVKCEDEYGKRGSKSSHKRVNPDFSVAVDPESKCKSGADHKVSIAVYSKGKYIANPNCIIISPTKGFEFSENRIEGQCPDTDRHYEEDIEFQCNHGIQDLSYVHKLKVRARSFKLENVEDHGVCYHKSERGYAFTFDKGSDKEIRLFGFKPKVKYRLEEKLGRGKIKKVVYRVRPRRVKGFTEDNEIECSELSTPINCKAYSEGYGQEYHITLKGRKARKVYGFCFEKEGLPEKGFVENRCYLRQENKDVVHQYIPVKSMAKYSAGELEGKPMKRRSTLCDWKPVTDVRIIQPEGDKGLKGDTIPQPITGE